jgi:hypothetical protein
VHRLLVLYYLQLICLRLVREIKINNMNIQVLGFVLVSGVFAIGLLIIGVYMIFDKTPSRKIPMPPRYLK